MIRIKLISDLHFDANRMDPQGSVFIEALPNKDVDVLVIAGDIITNGKIQNCFDAFKQIADKFPNVLYVLGNHDHYGNSVQQTHDIMENIQSKISNFHWLHNSKKEIDGKTFVGTALWFPDLGHMMPNKSGWVDFRHIKDDKQVIFEEHEKAKDYLKSSLNQDDILITHHLGSYALVADQYVGDMYNCYFVANIENIIVDKKPSYYFHGHSHQVLNGLKIADTYCYRNPRGYLSEYSYSGFDKDFILEV